MNSATRLHLRSVIAILCLTHLFASALCAAPQYRGLWLGPRKDAANSARADVAGHMASAPREVWSYGEPQEQFSYLKPLSVRGQHLYLAQVRRGVRLIRQDGSAVWSLPVLGVSRIDSVITLNKPDRPVALLQIGTRELAVLDVAGGRVTWRWSVPKGAYLGGYRLQLDGKCARLVIFPQNTPNGLCFEITNPDAPPRLLWQADYTGRYWVNYGPYFVFSDLDNDKVPEIVLVSKPGYVAAIDLLTGRAKFDLKYKITGGEDIGRPYGFIRSADIDGDGYRDVVVASCQVEHYISVIRNVGGKEFQLAWSQYLGYDLPVPEREVRPNVTSLSDVNADGKLEFVAGVFNPDGDNRWHTIVFDTPNGYHARLADLPGKYFWGCCDLTGDGVPEIITSDTAVREAALPARIEAIDGKTFQPIGTLDTAGLLFYPSRLGSDTDFRAVRSTPLLITTPTRVAGLVVRIGSDYRIWSRRAGRWQLKPYKVSAQSQIAINSLGTGAVEDTNLKIGSGKPVGPAASWPLVCQVSGQRQLVLALSDGSITGGTPDLSHPGRLKSAWKAPGTTPAAWIGPDGRCIVCAEDSARDTVYVYSPDETGIRTVSTINTPHPLSRGYSSNRSTLVPFGTEVLRIFIGLRMGPHPVASAVYDEHGQLVWQDPDNGPHPLSPGAGDLNGDGQPELFVDNHGKHIIYDSTGKGRVVAHGWYDDIPGRGDGAKYAIPIIGPYGPNGETRIVLGPGLDALETLDGAGARLAKQNYSSTYEFDNTASAVARIRTNGWDIGMVSNEGVFSCADVATCMVGWTLDLGLKPSAPISVTAGDVDGDGRDNFLVGLPDGRLLALDEREGRGRILWTYRFNAGISLAYLADVDGDGVGEIVVSLEDGRVKILAK